MSSSDEEGPEAPPNGADERPKEQRSMSDTVRKAISQGFRSVRSGGENIRGMVSEALPKEVVTYLKGAIDTGRDELVRIVGSQTRKFFEGIDVGGEVAKILTALSFEIKTEIRFIPNDQKVKPSIKTTIKPKRAKPEQEED
jgi:hypothetical protein